MPGPEPQPPSNGNDGVVTPAVHSTQYPQASLAKIEAALKELRAGQVEVRQAAAAQITTVRSTDLKPSLRANTYRPSDLDRKLRRARSSARWMADCASAMVVGGGSVTLTLLLAGIALHREAFLSLTIIYTLLAMSTSVLETFGRASSPLNEDSSLSRHNAFRTAALLIYVFALADLPSTHGTIAPFTFQWCIATGLSFVVAIFGAIYRRQAQTLIERWSGPMVWPRHVVQSRGEALLP